ncbi:MAG: bifunctional 4-hydroxy-2-oxoglutarate aldolase/2-dehydro-3-deoxy-phosphogluconate aldolase [Lentisphaeria bacterium]
MTLFEENVKKLLPRLRQLRVIPVLVLERLEEGLRVCELLVSNGLPVAEITFRTLVAAEIIARARREFPQLLIGAGTVLRREELERAMDAGAAFAVAPGFNPTVVKAAIEHGFPFAPGVCTPSEVEQAVELGCRLLKFFPAEAVGGLGMLKSLRAPYRHLDLSWLPTGGISSENAAAYLALPEVAAVGGTWLAKENDLTTENWDAIAEKIRAARRLQN